MIISQQGAAVPVHNGPPRMEGQGAGMDGGLVLRAAVSVRWLGLSGPCGVPSWLQPLSSLLSVVSKDSSSPLASKSRETLNLGMVMEVEEVKDKTTFSS